MVDVAAIEAPAFDPEAWSHGEVELEDVRLHYVEQGSGPAVLLLHGFPEFWYSWRFQIGALATAGYRVIALDMRGYNLSSKPERVSSYRPEVLCRDIAALMAVLEIDRASVVGHDWGAAVAWLFAQRYPELLSRLMILNGPHPTHFVANLGRLSQLRRSWYMAFFQIPGLPERLFAANDFARLRRLLRCEPARVGAFSADDIELYVAAAGQPGAMTAAINYYRAALHFGLRSFQRATSCVTAPTLVIWGRQDPHLEPWLAEPPRDLVASLRVEWIEAASHWVQVDAPERVNRALVSFLAEPDHGPSGDA